MAVEDQQQLGHRLHSHSGRGEAGVDVELQRREAGIEAARRQLAVAALVDEPAVVHHEDAVGRAARSPGGGR